MDEFFNNGTLSIIKNGLENGSTDIAIGTLFIDKDFDVEYGPVLFKDRVLIAFDKEKVIITAKLLQAFTNELWMYWFLTFGCTTLIYYILNIILENNCNTSLENCVMDFFRWSIGIGIGVLPKYDSVRMLIVFYILFNIIIDTVYLGKLSSILTVVPFAKINVPRLYRQIHRKVNTFSAYMENILHVRLIILQRLSEDHFNRYFVQTNLTEWDNLKVVSIIFLVRYGSY